MGLLERPNASIKLCRYKERFVAALPESRRSSADFSRPVFTAVAFYLCARRNKVRTIHSNKMFEFFVTGQLFKQC